MVNAAKRKTITLCFSVRGHSPSACLLQINILGFLSYNQILMTWIDLLLFQASQSGYCKALYRLVLFNVVQVVPRGFLTTWLKEIGLMSKRNLALHLSNTWHKVMQMGCGWGMDFHAYINIFTTKITFVHAAKSLNDTEITAATSSSLWFLGPEAGEMADHTGWSQMDTPPGATHPGNRKWTELAYNKLAELGWRNDFKGESLSNWAFVRMWYFTTILSLSSCCICPLATLMSSMCLFVCSAAALLKRFPMLTAHKYTIMRSVGGWAICRRWPITAARFDILKVCDRLWTEKHYTSAVLLDSHPAAFLVPDFW